MEGIDYQTSKTPPAYVCAVCGTSGVKLWREYQRVGTTLECGACACRSQGHPYEYLLPDGKYDHQDIPRGPCDSIGRRVPAVPDEEGDGYWGYTSIPDAGVNWWRALPNERQLINPDK